MTSIRKHSLSRRSFITNGSLALVGLAASNSLLRRGFPMVDQQLNSEYFGVQVGVITYSFRSMPGSAEQLLKYITASGISAIELMGDAVEEYAGKPKNGKEVADWRANVSMDKFTALKDLYNKAGVHIYAFKPDALGQKNTDAEIEYALKVAKALGARSVTVELPTDLSHSKRLGDLGEKHKVYIGYHAHTQATDTAWDAALNQSPYNSMNLDCGHYIAAGGDNSKQSLLQLIQAKHDRITTMHIKDRKTKDNGGANQPWGHGDTPIKEILLLLKEKQYKIPATIELEYDIPAGSDAVRETKNCLDYAKKALGAA